MKRILAVLLMTTMLASVLYGCKSSNSGGENDNKITDAAEPTGTSAPTDKPADKNPDKPAGQTDKPADKPAEPTKTPDEVQEGLSSYTAHPMYTSSANDITEVGLEFNAEGGYAFNEESTLYSNELTLTITAPEGAKVYYTFDGTVPDTESTEYTEPITLKAFGGKFPSAHILRAVAVFADGTVSKVAARTYLIASNLEGRFTTLIFSVSGDPADLTERPDGIFFGNNYNQRGRESERPVYVEAWRADGTCLIEQYAGVRIYGGYSRQSSIKSMKLFSRKSYDEDNKNFKFSEFGTVKLDGSGKVIKKYDKLVLRNFGNDMQSFR